MRTEKLYENDCYLREFTATVLECIPCEHSDGMRYGIVLDRNFIRLCGVVNGITALIEPKSVCKFHKLPPDHPIA